jgi:isocitrate/isopropylmalate dehydrogenase
VGATEAAERVESAISGVLAAGKIPDLSAGKCPPTSEIGDMIAGAV